jgi:hypothetical protein
MLLLQGMALGICPKDKLFRGYIDLEIQLREFDRCRILYQKFLEFGPENCVTWMRVSSHVNFSRMNKYKKMQITLKVLDFFN